jgi:hypothetical protein
MHQNSLFYDEYDDDIEILDPDVHDVKNFISIFMRELNPLSVRNQNLYMTFIVQNQSLIMISIFPYYHA